MPVRADVRYTIKRITDPWIKPDHVADMAAELAAMRDVMTAVPEGMPFVHSPEMTARIKGVWRKLVGGETMSVNSFSYGYHTRRSKTTYKVGGVSIGEATYLSMRKSGLIHYSGLASPDHPSDNIRLAPVLD